MLAFFPSLVGRKIKLDERMIKKVFVIAPFIIVAVIFTCLPLGEHSRIFNYEHILFQACINIAIFAINFSFIQYQFSPYRTLLKNISAGHIWAGIFILVLALVPLIGMILFDETSSIKIMLFVLPVEMGLGICLCLFVDYLTSPYTFLKRQVKAKRLDQYFLEYVPKIKRCLEDDIKLDLSKPHELPDFEWGINPLPEMKEEDPFELMTSLGITSIKNNDLIVFEKTIRTLIEALNYIDSKKIELNDDYKWKVKRILITVSYSSIRRLVDSVLKQENNEYFANRLVRIFSEVVKMEASKGNQTENMVENYVGEIEGITLKLLEDENSSTVILALTMAHQSALRGLDVPDEKDPTFKWNISYLVNVIKHIGQKAIKKNKSNVLYHCFDALGWLGCSAVKQKHIDMTKSILQSMVQLGREVRQSNMECFWSRCAVMPYDHLIQRVEWMATWVCSVEDDLEKWKRVFSTAYSRLNGVECTVEVDKKNKKFELTYTKKPHKELHMSHEGSSREVDYSNFAMLKDLVIY